MLPGAERHIAFSASLALNPLVVEQQPGAGAMVPAGLQVTIFVGRFSG
jgi:hypothetical protein